MPSGTTPRKGSRRSSRSARRSGRGNNNPAGRDGFLPPSRPDRPGGRWWAVLTLQDKNAHIIGKNAVAGGNGMSLPGFESLFGEADGHKDAVAVVAAGGDD